MKRELIEPAETQVAVFSLPLWAMWTWPANFICPGHWSLYHKNKGVNNIVENTAKPLSFIKLPILLSISPRKALSYTNLIFIFQATGNTINSTVCSTCVIPREKQRDSPGPQQFLWFCSIGYQPALPCMGKRAAPGEATLPRVVREVPNCSLCQFCAQEAQLKTKVDASNCPSILKK